MTAFIDVLIAASVVCTFGFVLALVSDWRWHR